MRWWLLLVLPGCLGAGFGHGHCGPMVDLAWQEPGLYDHLAYGDINADWGGADGALPWDGEPWPGARLARVAQDVPRPAYHHVGAAAYNDPHVMGVSLVREGVVELAVDGEVPEAEVREIWTAFVANVTDASPQDLQDAWPAFWASRQDSGSSSGIPPSQGGEWTERPHWSFHARPPGRLELDALAKKVDLPDATSVGVGMAAAQAAGWTFRFSLPAWELQSPEGSMDVDSADQVFFNSAGPAGSEGEARDLATRLLQRVGWKPAFADLEAVTMIC